MRQPILHRHARTVGCVAWLAFIAAGGVSTAKADDNPRSSPPDTNSYSRPVVAEDYDPLNTAGKAEAGRVVQFDVFVVDTVVNNTDPDLKITDRFNDGEVSIAVKPQHPDQLVMTAFSGSWGLRAPLWRSSNRGSTWTKEFTVNPPPGVAGVPGCPCDQTVDYTRFKGLAGAFLTDLPVNPTTSFTNIYSGLNPNPAALTFRYFENPPGVAQATNHLDGVNDEDQPWLLVGPQPGGSGENVYVAYDDFNTAPDMHVAVATATTPLNFTVDNISGFSTGFVNPGHRLAVDPSSGAVYSLFQRRIAAGAGGSQNINYMLNRSTDGGNTWSLNGSTTGIVVANADSTQPRPKFCTVNALLGGVDHAAVDPQTGDVVYVYGNRDPATGNNRLAMRRLTDDGAGGLAISPEIFITGQVQAAIPSVAVTDKGTIGVFYYTCDGTSLTGFPIFTAHFAVSTDQGATFVGIVLETFLSPATDNNDPRQRVLGDYMQVKAEGNQFYGGFTGNGVPFGRNISNNDPIFFNVSVEPHRAKIASN
jgi:hypothetical protein